MNIRTAKPEDTNALYEIETACFNPDQYHQTHKRQIRYLLTKGNADILLLEDKTGICGYSIILYKKRSTLGRLYSIAVKPELQGGEIGKKIFDASENAVKKRGLKGMILEIREDNNRHLERYLKLGYTQFGKAPDYYPDRASCLKLKKIFQ